MRSLPFLDVTTPAARSQVLREAAVGLAAVAVSSLAKVIVHGLGVDAASYAFFSAAVVTVTWIAGPVSGSVAAVASTLLPPGAAALGAARPTEAGIEVAPALMFAAESGFLVWFVARLRQRRAAWASRLEAAEHDIGRLAHELQELRALERAFDVLNERLHGAACVLLDIQGRVTRWSTAAERVYGRQAAAVLGEPWPTLGAAELPGDAKLRQLLSAAMTGGEAAAVDWIRRADGTRFLAELAVAPLTDGRGEARGFAVVIHDLTTEHELQEFRRQAIATQEALQGEADALAEQLDIIHTILDPALSDLAPAQLIPELLGRVLTTLRVSGAALIDVRDETRPLVIASPLGLAARPRRGATAAQLPRRLRIVQSEPRRVQEAAVAAWPHEVGLVATAPIAREKVVLGALELVMRRPRRWTERDALVLLLAADRAASALASTAAPAAAHAR